MKKISRLLLLSATLFLSTFFVGCKPQEEPIALEDITLSPRKKVVEKINPKPAEENVVEEQLQIPEIQPEENNKNKRLVVVNVTVDGGPTIGATVNLSSSSMNRNEALFIEKKTDESGIAEIYIPKNVSGFCAKAYNDNYISEIVTCAHLSPDFLSSKNIKLKLSGKGVVVTAIIENKPEIIKNLRAEIVRAISHNIDIGVDLVYAVTTNIVGDEITFPPTYASSGDLFVRLTGDNIPQCYSEKFKTKNKREVVVRIPGSAMLKGRLFLPDGTPVTNKINVRVSSSGKSKGIFKANYNIQPETDGSYEIKQLPAKMLFCQFVLNGYKTYIVNVLLTVPKTELDISFLDYPHKEVGGIVVTEFGNEPVAGVVVKARRWQGSSEPYVSCVTDRQGNFSIEVKEFGNCYFGEIIVEEPGFAKVIKRISEADNFIKIVLKQAGNITGKVMNKDGKLIPGITISISSFQVRRNVERVSSGSNKTFDYIAVSDSDGHYKFSNVVAPAKYGFRIDDFNSGWSLPSYHSDNEYTVEVEPDQTVKKDLIVQKATVIAIKAKESNGTPVLKYKYNCGLRKSDYGIHINKYVHLSEDEWYYLKTTYSGNGSFSCNASEEQKGLSLVTNDIPLCGEVTNYITLVFSNSEPELSGHIFNADGSPAANSRVQIFVKKNCVKSTADKNGYFEIQGAELKKGTMMNVDAYPRKGSFGISTNLPAGSKNVKLKFELPYKITGKVFLDDLDTPAREFIVNNNQVNNSKDGSFEILIERSRYNNRSTKVITISAADYLPVFVKYDFSGKDFCNVGNVILKSGKTAKIHGNVVDQNDKPLGLFVTLKCGDLRRTFSVMSNEKDGMYAFEDVPPGKGTITARSWLGLTTSHKFEVEEGDDLELPDLVLNYTNSAMVKLTLKLPDGTLPINTRIINQNFYIKKDGTAIGELKAGKYSGWKIKYDGQMYVADEFEITADSDELEIWMREE